MHSFITPRKKATVDTFTYMWLLFIVVVSLVLLGVGLYLKSENSRFDIYKTEAKSKIDSLKENKLELVKEIKYIKFVHQKYQNTIKSNKNLQKGLENLFSMIPDQVSLNKIVLDKYEIKLYGVVDSPKTYKLLLEPPLKSIFDSSKVGFTKRDDGTYLFSSYNKIKRVHHEK